MITAIKNIVDKMRGTQFPRTNTPSSGGFFANFAGSGIRIDENNVLSAPSVWSALQILGQTIAMLPLKVYDVDSDGNTVQLKGHLHNLLNKAPNQNIAAFTWRSTSITRRAVYGSDYNHIERNARGEAVSITDIDPALCAVSKRNGVKVFWKRASRDSSEWVRVDSRDMIQFNTMSLDNLTGIGLLDIFANAVGEEIALNNFSSTFFKRGAMPSMVLVHPDQLSPEAIANLKHSVAAYHTGTNNNHGILVLEEGMEAKPYSVDFRASQVDETKRASVQQIARILNVPPQLLAELSKGTYSNFQQAVLTFSRFSIAPLCKLIEQELTIKLFPGENDTRYVEHDVRGLERGDLASRMSAYATGIQNGIYSPNEVRGWENLEHYNGGDEILRPLNMGNPGGDPDDLFANLSGDDTRDSLIGKGCGCEGGHKTRKDAKRVTGNPSDRWRADGGAMKRRNRLRRKYERLLLSALDRPFKKELKAVRSQVKKHLSGDNPNVVEFLKWVDRFYGEEIEGDVVSSVGPIIRAYAEDMNELTASELEAETLQDDDKVSEFSERMTVSIAAAYISQSRGQIYALSKEPEGVAERLNERLDSWATNENGTPSKLERIAARQAVQTGEALRREHYKAFGVTKIVWRTTGDNCPYCNSLNGKVVDIERDEPFADEGDTLGDADNTYTLKFRALNPPIHKGCDCYLVPL